MIQLGRTEHHEWRCVACALARIFGIEALGRQHAVRHPHLVERALERRRTACLRCDLEVGRRWGPSEVGLGKRRLNSRASFASTRSREWDFPTSSRGRSSSRPPPRFTRTDSWRSRPPNRPRKHSNHSRDVGVRAVRGRHHRNGPARDSASRLRTASARLWGGRPNSSANPAKRNASMA